MPLSRPMALAALGSILLLVGGRAPDALTPAYGPEPLPSPLDATSIAPPDPHIRRGDALRPAFDPGATGPVASASRLGSLGADLRPAVSDAKHDEYVTDAGASRTPGLTAREEQLLAAARAARSQRTAGQEAPAPGGPKEKTASMPPLTPDPVSGVGVTRSLQEYGAPGLTPAELQKRDHHRTPAHPAGEGR